MTGLIREVHCLLLYKLVHLAVSLAASVEGREADDHFVGQDSEGPPVDGETVTALNKNLRSQIVRRSTEGKGLGVTFEHLGQTEIGQTDVAVLVHQDVLGLQITVDDVLLVQVA